MIAEPSILGVRIRRTRQEYEDGRHRARHASHHVLHVEFPTQESARAVPELLVGRN